MLWELQTAQITNGIVHANRILIQWNGNLNVNFCSFIVQGDKPTCTDPVHNLTLFTRETQLFEGNNRLQNHNKNFFALILSSRYSWAVPVLRYLFLYGHLEIIPLNQSLSFHLASLRLRVQKWTAHSNVSACGATVRNQRL